MEDSSNTKNPKGGDHVQGKNQLDNPKVSDTLNLRLIETLKQIDEGFRKVMVLYIIAFCLGIVLVIAAIIPMFFEVKDKVYTIIFGGMGIIDLTAFFIFKPIEDLQFSRGNLARIMTAFTSWINELKNWNEYIKKRSEKDPGITFEEMSKISEINISNTLRILKSSGYSLKVTKTEKEDEK